MKKVFTLVELLVSFIIFWILIWVLFKLYFVMLDLSVRIENEKTLNSDLMYFTQINQNLVDKWMFVDYSKYINNWESTLSGENNWLTSILYLSWWNWPVSIYLTWNCNFTWTKIYPESNCWIQMNNSWSLIDLTDKDKTYFSSLIFKILPIAPKSDYSLEFDDMYSDGFWVYAQSYIKKYNKQRWLYNVSVTYQNFYNIKSN